MCINPFKAVGSLLGISGGGSPSFIKHTPSQQVSAAPKQDYVTPEEAALMNQDRMMAEAVRMGNRKMRIDLNTNAAGGSGLRIM